MPQNPKPNPNKQQTLTYSHQDMIDATNAVKEGKMGLKAACKVFGGTRSALQNE